MNKILENIETIRKEKGIKQEVMAEKLGIKQSVYSRFFQVQDDMKLSKLLQICDILEISLVDVVTYPQKYVPETEQVQPCESCKEKDAIISNLNKYIAILEKKK